MLRDSLITVATATTMPPRRRHQHLHLMFCPSVSASATPLSINQTTMDSSSRRLKTYQEVVKSAREKFTQEFSFPSKDKDISLAKCVFCWLV
ncbi:hypothetical protein NC653_007804 [Populus alba x Populus x berolinensis]|uniref:Uncharacterized protein n=1 Tax=Populus alba x Populus x berolinensis TaxID=444605 RepID=A0AAD6R597_9ROSI|nr:hypothetical protein NC653_007804 [Populus alba x Populus x berolinensis]